MSTTRTRSLDLTYHHHERNKNVRYQTKVIYIYIHSLNTSGFFHAQTKTTLGNTNKPAPSSQHFQMPRPSHGFGPDSAGAPSAGAPGLGPSPRNRPGRCQELSASVDMGWICQVYICSMKKMLDIRCPK